MRGAFWTFATPFLRRVPRTVTWGASALVGLFSPPRSCAWRIATRRRESIDASTAVLVIQLQVPFLALLGALLLHEQVGLRKWLGIAIAFAGVGLIAGEPRLGQAWGSLDLLVGGAFSWALGQIMVHRLGEIGGLTMIAWVAVYAAP